LFHVSVFDVGLSAQMSRACTFKVGLFAVSLLLYVMCMSILLTMIFLVGLDLPMG